MIVTPDSPAELGDFLRKRREALGLTLRETADKSALTLTCVWKIEHGAALPQLLTLTLLCKTLGLSVEVKA
jgi:transcriptional regulator with XRE-family HTH domain